MAKISTFTDDFSGSSLDAEKWSGYGASVTGNKAYLNGNIYSVTDYDLTNSSFFLKVAMNPDLRLALTLGGVSMDVSFGMLTMRVQGSYASVVYYGDYSYGGGLYGGGAEDIVGTFSASVVYDPVEMAWWRVREADGLVFFDVSRDGSNWNNLASAAHALDLTNVTVSVGAY